MRIMPRWTKKAKGEIWQQLLADVEASNALTKSIVWRSSDFLRHVVREKEGRGAIIFTYVCEYCKLSFVEYFPWSISANHGVKKRKIEKTTCTDGGVVLAECHMIGGSQTACSRCNWRYIHCTDSLLGVQCVDGTAISIVVLMLITNLVTGTALVCASRASPKVVKPDCRKRWQPSFRQLTLELWSIWVGSGVTKEVHEIVFKILTRSTKRLE